MSLVLCMRDSAGLLDPLLRAHGMGRMPHALLLHGENPYCLNQAAQTLASEVLCTAQPLEHPDCFVLRPSHKMRQIRVEDMRSLLRNLSQTSHQGGHKLGLVYDADRMNKSTANTFLKTLEEPPQGSYLILLSTRPQALLPTILSRCMALKVPGVPEAITDPNWKNWLSDYQLWFQGLQEKSPTPVNRAQRWMGLYGLVARFQECLDTLSAGLDLSSETETPEARLEEGYRLGLEASQRKALQQQLLTEIAYATHHFALAHLGGPEASQTVDRLIKSLEHLHRLHELLEYNLAEAPMLEGFLIGILNIWTPNSLLATST